MHRGLCEICNSKLKFIDPKKRCIKCGLPKDGCQCGHRVFYFENAVCVFEYSDVARDVMLKYKFSHYMHLSKFFAEYMVKSVKKEYNGIKFSAVCFVPTSATSKTRRGYDQSKLLAREMAKRLKLPLVCALHCKSFRKPQHKSTFSRRLINVLNKYTAKRRVGGNVLLVDDIKTTGSTLDECALMLLKSGADRVYCVTAMASVFRKND